MNYTFFMFKLWNVTFCITEKETNRKVCISFKDKCFKALFWVNLIMNHQSCKYLCMPIYKNGYFCKKSI